MDDNWVKTIFQESVTMSTYLVFFMVSDFDYLEADYKGKPVSCFKCHFQHIANVMVRAYSPNSLIFKICVAGFFERPLSSLDQNEGC